MTCICQLENLTKQAHCYLAYKWKDPVPVDCSSIVGSAAFCNMGNT